MKRIINYFYNNPEEDNLIAVPISILGIITIIALVILKTFGY